MRTAMASILAAGILSLAQLPFGTMSSASAEATQTPAATQAPTTKPQPANAKPAAKSAAKPAAKPATGKATPAKAKATSGKKPAAKPVASKPPAKPGPPRAIEKKFGDVVSIDYPDAEEVRLDGPWREHGYPLRLWITSYVRKGDGQRRHQLSVQVTHHEEAARNYVRAELPAPAVLAQTARPSLQCTRNRDGSRQCFHTEAYVLDLPEEVLKQARAAGTTIMLAADQAEPFKVPLDAATIDAQLKACETLTPVAAAEKKP